MKFADNHSEGLTSMIQTLEKFVRKNKLTININKTKVLIFKNEGKNKRGEKWKYKNMELEIVKEYKYLGVWFSTGNNFEKHIKKNTKNRKGHKRNMGNIQESKNQRSKENSS